MSFNEEEVMRADRVEDALDRVGGGNQETQEEQRKSNMVHIQF